MRYHGKNIFENRIITALLIFVLVKPPYVGTIDWIDAIYDWSKLLIAVILIIISLIAKPFTKTRLWILIFYGYIFIITFFLSGNLYDYMRVNFASFAMCLMFDIWLCKSPKTLINSFAILEILVYINLLTVILFPDGLYETVLYTANWFMGYKNTQIRTLLPIVSISLIRSYYKYKKITLRTYLLLFSIGITLIMIHSATALIGYGLFIGFLMLYHNKNKELPFFITLSNGLLVAVVVFFILVVFRMHSYFNFFFEAVLGKKLSIVGRTHVWGISLRMLKSRPIFGFGYLTNEEYVSYFGRAFATHPHNYFLYILLTGGFVLGAILLWAYYQANRSLNRSRDIIYSKIILIALFAFLAMGLAEALTSTVLLYPMLVLGMNAEKMAALSYEGYTGN